MKGTDIKADVQAILDDTGIHWPDPQLLLWINAGQRDICTYKPKAASAVQNIQLAAASRQATPTGAVQVLALRRNMGASGTVPGRAITLVAEDRLAAARPSWTLDTGPAVRHHVADDRDSGSFYVWPAPTAPVYVEALVQKQPTDLAALSDTLTIDDSYRNALGEYVLHCAYAMEGEGFNAEVSAAHYAKYAQIIGIQIKQQKKASAPANGAESPAYPAVDKNGA